MISQKKTCILTKAHSAQSSGMAMLTYNLTYQIQNMPAKTGQKIGANLGQKFSKSKKLKILNEDKKDYNKITTFC